MSFEPADNKGVTFQPTIPSGSTLLFNPLRPKISMHILHTALNTFPKVLTRRICLPIKSLFRW